MDTRLFDKLQTSHMTKPTGRSSKSDGFSNLYPATSARNAQRLLVMAFQEAQASRRHGSMWVWAELRTAMRRREVCRNVASARRKEARMRVGSRRKNLRARQQPLRRGTRRPVRTSSEGQFAAFFSLSDRMYSVAARTQTRTAVMLSCPPLSLASLIIESMVA